MPVEPMSTIPTRQPLAPLSNFTTLQPRIEEEPSEVTDCALDDPELFTTKRHLLMKTTPLSLVNQLQSKHKNLNITETIVQEDPPRFGYTVTI